MAPTIVPCSLESVIVRISILGLLAAVLAVTAGLGLWMWGTAGYMNRTFIQDPVAAKKSLYDKRSMTGLLCFVTSGGSAVCLLHVTAQSLLRFASASRQSVRYTMALGLYVALALAFIMIGAVMIATWATDPLLTCGIIGCVGNLTYAPTNPNALGTRQIGSRAVFAMTVFFTVCPVGLVMLRRAGRLAYQRWRVADASSAKATVPPPSIALYRHDRTLRHTLYLVAALVAIAAFAIVTFYLPNDPRFMAATLIATRARLRASYGTRNATHVVPERPHAVFRTSNVVLSDALVLKIFPGNLFFYVYLALVLCLMYVLRLSARGRTWLQRPVPVLSGRRGIVWVWGQLLLILLTVLLAVLFSVYWFHDHNYKQRWQEHLPPGARKMHAPERVGRSFGQLSVMLLSLLMFPASRNSASFIYSLLGVSRESFLWTHRVLGYGMLLATLAHAMAHGFAFHQEGRLRWNLFRLPTYVYSTRLANDFTLVPALWVTTLLLVAMGIFALGPIRRRCFELFYYTHLFAAYAAFPVILWHSASGWQYLLPGLTLWMADRLLRLYRSASHVEVVSARVLDATAVEVRFLWNDGGCGGARAGQYVFVNVPALSLLQWHPFTLSGAPFDANVYTLHIKRVPFVNSWTNQLYMHVLNGRPFTMGVDGPCGCPPNVLDYEEVILVAGGIGITPCAAIFQALRHHAATVATSDKATPRRVRLLWSVRSEPLVAALLPTLTWKAPPATGVTSSFTSANEDSVELPNAVVGEAPCLIFLTGEKPTASLSEGHGLPNCGHDPLSTAPTDRSCDPRERSPREHEDDVVGMAVGKHREVDDISATDIGTEVVASGGVVRYCTGRPNWAEQLYTTTPPSCALVFVCGPVGLVETVVHEAVTRGMTVHVEEFCF